MRLRSGYAMPLPGLRVSVASTSRLVWRTESATRALRAGALFAQHLVLNVAQDVVKAWDARQHLGGQVLGRLAAIERPAVRQHITGHGLQVWADDC